MAGDASAAGQPAGEDLLRDHGRGVHAHEQQREVQLDPQEGGKPGVAQVQQGEEAAHLRAVRAYAPTCITSSACASFLLALVKRFCECLIRVTWHDACPLQRLRFWFCLLRSFAVLCLNSSLRVFIGVVNSVFRAILVVVVVVVARFQRRR